MTDTSKIAGHSSTRAGDDTTPAPNRPDPAAAAMQSSGDKPHGPDGSHTDGNMIDDHIALKNQSSVSAKDYPEQQRKAQDLCAKPDR